MIDEAEIMSDVSVPTERAAPAKGVVCSLRAGLPDPGLALLLAAELTDFGRRVGLSLAAVSFHPLTFRKRGRLCRSLLKKGFDVAEARPRHRALTWRTPA